MQMTCAGKELGSFREPRTRQWGGNVVSGSWGENEEASGA